MIQSLEKKIGLALPNTSMKAWTVDESGSEVISDWPDRQVSWLVRGGRGAVP